MRKLIIPSLVALLGMGTTAALADVFVTVDVDKTKDIRVIESLTVTKTVTLEVTVDIAAEKFAESDVVANQRNQNNKACSNCAEKVDEIVNGSVSGNHGVTTVNQAGGNMNNQGSVISAAIDARVPVDVPPPTPGTDTLGGFAESQVSAEQINGGRENFSNVVDTVNIIFRDALIAGSVNNNHGVTHVNQSPGNMNNQLNALSLAVSLRDTGVALSEADLGQLNASNLVQESDSAPQGGIFGIHKSATISGSINGNKGITGVNQASGNMANQANVVSIAVVSDL